MLLYETPAGYALFKVTNEDLECSQIQQHFDTVESTNKLIKLKAFAKFGNTTEALSAVTGVVEGKLSKSLKTFLTKEFENNKDTQLMVADTKLGSAIAKKLGIQVVSDANVFELMRGIRSQLSSLISGISTTDYNSMVLGLSHSLSRYKLKFSPDKVDTMIIQAIHLLDDLDKELNTYAMRVKEWYGWHFPEMTKIIVDNIAYAKCVLAIGFRSNTASTDLSTVLPEDLETELKAAAQVSMGTEISDSDIENIHFLCDQVVSIAEYRAQLFDYLKNRMAAIAPNLTAIVGEIVGAKLIAHAGSLMSLAKSPASTVQILGAEKALFRALKTKHDTPKYGLIYHASLVGQAAPKNKGKMARIIATKATLALRVDALAEFGEDDEPTIGIQQRAKAEARLRQLEGKATLKEYSASGKKMAGQKKFEITPAKSYNPSNDMDITSTSPAPVVKDKKKKKKEKKSVGGEEVAAAVPSKKRKTVDEDAGESEKKKKKSKKSKTSE